jgi:predicted small metal-binding protein
MGKLINCECGEAVRGSTDAELLAAVQAHVNRDHPELIGKLSSQDILSMAEEDDDAAKDAKRAPLSSG